MAAKEATTRRSVAGLHVVVMDAHVGVPTILHNDGMDEERLSSERENSSASGLSMTVVIHFVHVECDRPANVHVRPWTAIGDCRSVGVSAGLRSEAVIGQSFSPNGRKTGKFRLVGHDNFDSETRPS
jgi:hypothetical protein